MIWSTKLDILQRQTYAYRKLRSYQEDGRTPCPADMSGRLIVSWLSSAVSPKGAVIRNGVYARHTGAQSGVFSYQTILLGGLIRKVFLTARGN